eukprot:9370708-Lingulodinium_polyedra.AAC.1
MTRKSHCHTLSSPKQSLMVMYTILWSSESVGAPTPCRRSAASASLSAALSQALALAVALPLALA